MCRFDGSQQASHCNVFDCEGKKKENLHTSERFLEVLRHTSSGTSYIFNKVANKAHSIVILSMVTCCCRTKEHTELLHTALVCRWSKRKTQQVHHGAAWTTGQGNSQRGCHCSLAGCRKLPEAHQRPATERRVGGFTLLPPKHKLKISPDCDSSQKYPHRLIMLTVSFWRYGD